MKTNKIFGFMVALTLSTQVMAYGQDDAPPFDSFTCESGNISVQVKVQHYRQTYGAGPAAISAEGSTWSGGWHWAAAEEGTRLTGYHHLTIKANAQNGSKPIYLHTLYNPYGELSGGWLEMPGTSGSIDCKID